MTNTQTIKDRLVGARCTLDGKPASIVGAQLPYAVIWTDDGKMKFEWAWATAERIMAKGGAFKS